MSNNASISAGAAQATGRGHAASAAVAASLKKRYAAEKRFRAYGILAIAFRIAVLDDFVRHHHRQGHPCLHANEDRARYHALSSGHRSRGHT